MRVRIGVVGAGFITIVFPASSAGAIFAAGMSSGKFQGLIPATTPRGRWRSSTRPPGT